MGSRTVRLDDEAERALGEIQRGTGMSISEALKRGLLALRENIRNERAGSPWAVYEKIELGPGGYAAAPANAAKRAIRDVVRRKRRH